MKTPAEALEIMIHSSQYPPEEIEFAHRNDPVMRRLAVLGAIGVARKFPNTVRGIYDHAVLFSPYRLIGQGYDHVVIGANDQKVLKIDRHSRRMPPAQQEDLAREKKHLYKQGEKIMNGFLIEQTVSVRPIPVSSWKTACVTEQPYIKVGADIVFDDVEKVVGSMQEMGLSKSKITDDLERICEITEEGLDEGTLAPDIGGRGNLAVTERGLILLDSYLTTAEVRQRLLISPDYRTVGEHHRAVLDQLWERAEELKVA